MDKSKAVFFLEHSFLRELLLNEEITDISYNGEDVYYVSNNEGRKKSDICIDSLQVKDFIRQIANLCEAQFSFSNPELDLTVGKYRINAIHQSIARVRDEGVTTFSIRIGTSESKINDNSDFFNPHIVELIKVILDSKMSIVIGGVTSSGKTEFQKYLLSKLEESSRVIVIDNVLELDQIRNPNLDLTCWQCDEKNTNASPSKLIKAALRNNPDWLILAEARDKEMVDVLNCAMTGIPIITTLHTYNVFSIPHRMGRLMLRSEQRLDFGECLNDINYHFHFYFYLEKKKVHGKIHRYIKQICIIDEEGNKNLIYEKRNCKDCYYKITKENTKYLNLDAISNTFNEIFGGKYE